jgi:hypothetical protein
MRTAAWTCAHVAFRARIRLAASYCTGDFMPPNGSREGDFVVAYVARDEVEARAMVVLLRDKGIPSSAERRQASNIFVASDTQTSILTMRKDVARARAIIESLSAEERERMRRSMSETVFMALDPSQIEQIIRAERAAAERAGLQHAQQPLGDKTMILQGRTIEEAEAAAARLEQNGIPAIVIGGAEASRGVLPAVYVPMSRAAEAGDIMRKFLAERACGAVRKAADESESRESRRGTVRDAPPVQGIRSFEAGIVPRCLALACGAALLAYSVSASPNPLLVLLAGGPLLVLLACLCLSAPSGKKRGEKPVNEPSDKDLGNRHEP